MTGDYETDPYGKLLADCSRAYLKHVAALKRRSDEAEQLMEELLAKATHLKAIRYDATRVDATRDPDGMAELIEQMDEAQAAYLDFTGQWLDEIAAAAKALADMPNQALAHVIDRHYLGGATVQQLALELNYSTRQVDNLIRAGLVQLHEFIPPGWRLPRHNAL